MKDNPTMRRSDYKKLSKIFLYFLYFRKYFCLQYIHAFLDVFTRCSMLGEAMFSTLRIRKSKHIDTAQTLTKNVSKNEKEIIVAMVIDNLQTYRKKIYFISFMHLAFNAVQLARNITDCSITSKRLYRVCVKRNHITCAISFTASQLNGLFSLLFFYFFSGGLQFYSQNSWFSDIIFEHNNNFLPNTGRWTGIAMISI